MIVNNEIAVGAPLDLAPEHAVERLDHGRQEALGLLLDVAQSILEDRALEGTPIVVAAVQDAVGEVGAVEPDAVGWVREQHAT